MYMENEKVVRALESLSMTDEVEPKIVVHVALGLTDLYDLMYCLQKCAEKSDDFETIAAAVEYNKFFKHCKEVAHEAKNYK